MNITYLPKPEELSFHLRQVPQHPDQYKDALKSLAKSIQNYSEQIAQILEAEDIVDSLGDKDEEK